MYNDPIEEKEFSFYLNFKNDNTGLLQISEPVKFDASNFVIEQESKRYGRDVFFMNEEISLEFYNDYFVPTNENVVMPSGAIVRHLTHGFEYLNLYYREFGFESEVEFILKRNDIEFITGVLDFSTAETDELTYYNFKVIQNTKQAQIKRREDVEIDLFSSEDLDGNEITPLSTTNILLRAKPIVQVSEFGEKDLALFQHSNSAFSSFSYIPISNQLIKFGIEDTYAPFDAAINLIEPSSSRIRRVFEDNKIIVAATTLTNLSIRIKNLSFLGQQNYGSAYVYVTILKPSSFGQTYILYDSNGADVFSVTNQDYSLQIPILEIGDSLSIMLVYGFSSASFLNYNMFVRDFHCDGIEIETTSTAIDSVIKGVRHADLIKQTVKSINGMSVTAPKYDVGGAFYDNFVFNGKLIRQFSEEPFYSKFKDAVSQLQELNSDYQINENEVYIGQYNDYYPNNELNSFLQKPDEEYKTSFNDRYSINTMEYNYKSFEQDKDESNTIDAVHTNSQWLLPNKQVENTLKIEVDYVRDPFEIESARRQGINTKDTTSLSNDDKIYIIDVVTLAPNTRNDFTALLQYQYSTDDNNLKLLSDGSFNWTLLGFNVGNTVNVIVGTTATRAYTVTAYENSLITLTPNVGTITNNNNGSDAVQFEYPLTGVNYVNRTNQEFQVIENVASPDNFSNLQYTIKRNLKHYESYLACASKYKLTGVIKNTYFKSNGDLITEFRNGGEIKESDSFTISELETRLLEPIIIETKVIAEYDEMLVLLQNMQAINVDNSIGGFIRVMDANDRIVSLYPTKIDYNWGTKVLEITGEQRYISDVVEINKIGDLIYINQVGYSEQIVKPINIKTNGDYIQLFDYRWIALFNKINFSKVYVNSNKFSNIVELSDALIQL